MSDQVWEIDGEIAEIQFQLVQQVKAAHKLLALLQTEEMEGLDVLFQSLFANVSGAADKLEMVMTRERKQVAAKKKRGAVDTTTEE